MYEDKLTLRAFEFSPVNGVMIEKVWADIKMDYPDAIFKQVVVQGEEHVGMLLAFI